MERSKRHGAELQHGNITRNKYAHRSEAHSFEERGSLALCETVQNKAVDKSEKKSGIQLKVAWTFLRNGPVVKKNEALGGTCLDHQFKGGFESVTLMDPRNVSPRLLV